MRELLKIILIGIALQSAQSQFFQQQTLPMAPYMYQNASYSGQNMMPAPQAMPMQQYQYAPTSIGNIGHQAPQMVMQQPMAPSRMLYSEPYSQPMVLQRSADAPQQIATEVQQAKVETPAVEEKQESATVRQLTQSLQQNDAQHAETAIVVDSTTANKKQQPRKAMDTDVKKMRLLRVFKDYIRGLRKQKINNRDALLKSFNDFFSSDKDFYTKNFLPPVVKNFNMSKRRVNFHKLEAAIVRKLITVDVGAAKLDAVSKPLKSVAVAAPVKQQQLKLFRHVKSALKKRGLSLPQHFYKNYTELKKMARLYEFKLQHPAAKEKFTQRLNALHMDAQSFGRALKQKQQFFTNFDTYYRSLQKNVKTKKVERMVGRIQRMLQRINNASYGIIYIKFTEGYSQRHIDGNNVTGNQSRDLNGFLDGLIARYHNPAYLRTIFSIFKSFKQLGDIHFDSNDKTFITFDLFLQYFKNKIKQGELRFLLHNYFTRFFREFDAVKGGLLVNHAALSEQITFDYAKFLSELFRHYSLRKFMRLNRLLGEFDAQLAKVENVGDAKYHGFLAELNKIFFSIFKEFLIIRSPQAFEEFAREYGIPASAYPSVEAFHVQNDDASFHALPGAAGVIRDDNPDESQLLDNGDVEGVVADLSKVVDTLAQSSGAQSDEQLRPVYSSIEEKLKQSLPAFYGRYKTIVDRHRPSDVNTSSGVTPVKVSADVTSRPDANSTTTPTDADVTTQVGTQKRVTINMKVIKSGRMVTRLLYEFLQHNTKQDNGRLVALLADVDRAVDPLLDSKLDFLYHTLDVYTKRFEMLLLPEDLQKLKHSWKVFVIFYSKNCHLTLYKKVVQRLAEFKADEARFSFVRLRNVLSNLVLFVKSNKKYDFKKECNQLSKLITMQKKLTMFKLQKLNALSGDKKQRVYLRRRNNILHMIKKAIVAPSTPKLTSKPASKPSKRTRDSDEEPVGDFNSNDIRGSSSIKHSKYMSGSTMRKRTYNGGVTIKKLFKGGDDRNKPFGQKKRESPSDNSNEDVEPIENSESKPVDSPASQTNESSVSQSDLQFIKKLLVTTTPVGSSTSSVDTSKLALLKLQPKTVSYLKFLREKYSDPEQALASKRGFKIFDKLNKIYYKRNPGVLRQFRGFTQQLLKEVYLNKLKDDLSRGGAISSQKLVFKPNLNAKKKIILKALFNKFSSIDAIKQKGLGDVVFNQLNKVLFKPFKKQKEVQKVFDKVRAYNIAETSSIFEGAGDLEKTYIKPYKPLTDSEPAEEPVEEPVSTPVVPEESKSDEYPDEEPTPHLPPRGSYRTHDDQPSSDEQDVKAMCKVVKHCKQRCFKVIGEQRIEILPGDPLYQHSICGKEDESGEEEVPCSKVAHAQSKQINIQPTFFMNIEVDNASTRDQMFSFLKNSDFIQKLSNNNEIDVKKFKQEVAHLNTSKSFNIDVTPYKGDERVQHELQDSRSRSKGFTDVTPPVGEDEVSTSSSTHRGHNTPASYHAITVIDDNIADRMYEDYTARPGAVGRDYGRRLAEVNVERRSKLI